MPASQHVTWKGFVRLLPLAPSYWRLYVQFWDILKFCLLKIVGGTRLGVGLKIWSYSNTGKNLRGQHPLGAEIWSSYKVHFWHGRNETNSSVSGPKFTCFFTSNVREIVVDNAVICISIRSRDIRDWSLKLSKIAPNFGGFLPSQILRGWSAKKLYSNFYACLAARDTEKFREVTPFGPKVIGAHTFNFWPIVKFCFLKIVGGLSFRFWICDHMSGAKIFAIEVWCGPKSTLILHVFFGPELFSGEDPQNGPRLSCGRTFRPRGKVSRRSADGARRSRGEKIKEKKHPISSKTLIRRELPFRAAYRHLHCVRYCD